MISVSLQTMRLGVLPWERLKNRENLELGPSWESQSNAIADLFVMFIAWTSQKASKVHKILSQKLAIALISNIQSLHITEENLSSWEMFKIITSEALDTMHAQLFLMAERERSTTVVVLISGAFVRSRLITNLSTPEWCICISQCPQ